jgi:hypothetical protein
MKNSEPFDRIVWLPIALILLAIFATSLTKVANVDIWGFLKTGEHILATQTSPYSDPFSYTMKGQAWRGQVWLSPVVFHLLHKKWGIGSLVILKALLFTAVFVFLLAVFRQRRVSIWLSLLTLLLVLFVVQERLMVRSEVISWLFMAVFIYVLESHRQKKRGILVLPFLMILWANMHIGCIFGVGVLLAYLAGETVKYGLHRYKGVGFDQVFDQRDLLCFAAVVFITAGAAFINPNVHEVFTTPFLVGRDPFLMANIEELCFSGILRFKLFWIMVALCVSGVVLRLKQVDPVDLFLLALFLPLSLKVQRNIPIFAIVAAPMVAHYWHVHLKRLVERLPNRFGTAREFPVSWKTCANVFVSLLLVILTASALRRVISFSGSGHKGVFLWTVGLDRCIPAPFSRKFISISGMRNPTGRECSSLTVSSTFYFPQMTETRSRARWVGVNIGNLSTGTISPRYMSGTTRKTGT